MAQQQITLRVGGMTCAHCGQHVVAALEDLPGVERAEVSDWKSAQAIVLADEQVKVDRLLTAVNEAGYTASLLA